MASNDVTGWLQDVAAKCSQVLDDLYDGILPDEYTNDQAIDVVSELRSLYARLESFEAHCHEETARVSPYRDLGPSQEQRL